MTLHRVLELGNSIEGGGGGGGWGRGAGVVAVQRTRLLIKSFTYIYFFMKTCLSLKSLV